MKAAGEEEPERIVSQEPRGEFLRLPEAERPLVHLLRSDPRDVLLCHDRMSIDSLDEGAREVHILLLEHRSQIKQEDPFT